MIMLEYDGPMVVKSRLTKEQRELQWYRGDKRYRSVVHWTANLGEPIHSVVTIIGGKTYYS